MDANRPAECSADLKMRRWAHWSNASKRLGVRRSSEDTSLITAAVQNGIRARKLPLFGSLNKCVRSEGGDLRDGEGRRRCRGSRDCSRNRNTSSVLMLAVEKPLQRGWNPLPPRVGRHPSCSRVPEKDPSALINGSSVWLVLSEVPVT